MTRVLTPANFPILDGVGFLTKVADIFRPAERVKVEWTSPSYRKQSFLWGAYMYECGERKTFEVVGKPGFCAAVIKELSLNGTTVVKGVPLVPSRR